jgi:5-methylcytosine-specific restriction endonuclease McrA
MVEAAVCVRCGELKDAEAFPPNGKKVNGRDSWCRSCHRVYRSARYKRDIDKVRVQTRTWEKANPDKVRAKSARMYARHKDKKLATSRAWHQAHPEQRRELWNEWARKNPGKIRERTLLRAARKNAAAGSATSEQIMARVEIFGCRCWMCGAPWTDIDHVIPLAARGSNWPANLRPACKPCNSRKRDRDWRQFGNRLFDRNRDQEGVRRCLPD